MSELLKFLQTEELESKSEEELRAKLSELLEKF